MSYVGMDHEDLWPEFNMTARLVWMLNNVLHYDIGANSHPIHRDAWTETEIKENMDTIGYDKGASIVNMLKRIIGPGPWFDEGMTEYLTKYSDKAVGQEDLFEVLNHHEFLPIPKNISEIMKPWTLQKGFPLLRVEERPPNAFVVSQVAPYMHIFC